MHYIFSFAIRKETSKPAKKTQDGQAEESPPNEYNEIDFTRLNKTSSRNTNIYSEIEQTETRQLEHSDSVDTGYCDACSVHDMVDSNSSGMSSAGNYNMQCENNCTPNTSINREQSQDTRKSEVTTETSHESLQDVHSVSTTDLHDLHDSVIVTKREHAVCSHDLPSDTTSTESPFNRLNAGFHETVMTDNDTLYNKTPNIIT